MSLLIAVLFAKASEQSAILIGATVLFVNLGDRMQFLVVDFVGTMNIVNGLHVMLNMVDMAVVFALTLDLDMIVSTDIIVANCAD